MAFPAVQLPEGWPQLSAAGLKPEAAIAEGGLAVAIWTTTPWTLPANLAVSVNERLDYAICAVSPRGEEPCTRRQPSGGGSRAAPRPRSLGLELQPLLSVKGADLEGIVYRHPLLERAAPW